MHGYNIILPFIIVVLVYNKTLTGNALRFSTKNGRAIALPALVVSSDLTNVKYVYIKVYYVIRKVLAGGRYQNNIDLS